MEFRYLGYLEGKKLYLKESNHYLLRRRREKRLGQDRYEKMAMIIIFTAKLIVKQINSPKLMD